MASGCTNKEGTGTNYSLVVDANGYLKVVIEAGGGGGGTLVDDAAFTVGGTEVMVLGALADETGPDSVDEGDGGAVRMSLDRMLLSQVSGRAAENAAAAGNPVLAGGRYDATPRTLGDADAGALALNAEGRLIIAAATEQLLASFNVVDASANTPYVLVDLSDSSNFPHSNTTSIRLKKLLLDAEITGDGDFNLHVGVVKENDGTDGSVDWLHTFHMEHVGNADDDTEHRQETIDFCAGGDPAGLNLVVSGGALTYVLTGDTQASNVNWQNDVARTSPAGTSNPGTGDLVAWLEWTNASGGISFTLSAVYTTE